LDTYSIISIIPARGNSKRIPGKNVELVLGKPLVTYPIKTSLNCRSIERTIVSTDSKEIADLSKKQGAEVPFMRPAELAEDTTPDLPVFIHALEWLKRNDDYIPSLIVHLRATSPSVHPKHVEEAIAIMKKNKEADSLRSVVKARENPYKMWMQNGDSIKPLLINPKVREAYSQPDQLSPTIYWQNAHVDIIRYETIMEKHSMTGEKIIPYIMDEKYSIDINDPIDLKLAEFFMEVDHER
jgi:N-acylneuraminate cytidylyltransferase